MDRQAFSQVQQLSGSFFVSRALHVVAELGVADWLDDNGTSPLAKVARATGADEQALGRVLRLLSSHGIFTLHGAFVGHSAASELLRSDHPASLRDFARMFGGTVMWRSAEGLLHSIRTGEAAAPRMFPNGGFWGYLESHPDEARVFDAAMMAKARVQIEAILAAHDFAQYESVADIGGGQGHLLRAALTAHPALQGVLFELPHVIEAARSANGFGDRLAFQAGDFFKDDLPKCDAYILMEIVHDWADMPACDIIAAVRRAARPESKLLVIETVVPEGPAVDWSKTLDIVMLTLFAGSQRTTEQYRDLLSKGSFALKRVTDTGAGISIFEAEAI